MAITANATASTLDPDQYRKKLASMLMENALSTKPVGHWTEGVNRMAQALLVGLDERDLQQQDQAYGDVLKNLPGLNGAPTTAPSAVSETTTAPMGANVATQMTTPPTTGKIYSNDEPSPLDPPSGNERDMMARLLLAEAGNQGPVGQQAVAEVIRNRAVNGGFGGDTAIGVMNQKGQFEPAMTAAGRQKMASYDPNSPQYAQASAAIDSAYRPETNVTGGAVNFYAPKAQAALALQDGRPVVPDFARGRVGQDIGDHRFFGGVPQQPVQVASLSPAGMPTGSPAGPASAPPTGAGPQAPVQVAQAGGGLPQTPQIPPQIAEQIRGYMGSRDPRVRALGVQLYQQYATPPKLEKLNDYTLYNPRDGRTIAIPDRKPMTVGKDQRLASPEGKVLLDTKADNFSPLVDPAERARFGIPADDKRPYQLGPDGKLYTPPGGTSVNIDQRGEGAFKTEAGKIQAKSLGELVDSGRNAKQALSDVQTLSAILANIDTGKMAEAKALIGPYAQALGIKVDGLNEMQAAEAIVARVAPTLRVPGQGAQSDYELRNFLKSIPSIGATPQGNQIIGQTLQGLYDARVKAAEIASAALNGRATPEDADRQIRELPDPMAPYRDYLRATKDRAVEGVGPPPAAIEALRANPQFRDQFESKYGSGSAAKVLGQ